MTEGQLKTIRECTSADLWVIQITKEPKDKLLSNPCCENADGKPKYQLEGDRQFPRSIKHTKNINNSSLLDGSDENNSTSYEAM